MSILQGLCSCDGKLWAAWKGEVGDDRLFYSSSVDGKNWALQQTYPIGESSVGPALVRAGAGFYTAWKGMHGDERLWFTPVLGQQAGIPGVGSSIGPLLYCFSP